MPEYEGRAWTTILRMMPDYGPEAIWLVAGPWISPEAQLPADLAQELDNWVEEWAASHDCNVHDETYEDWVSRGRVLHAATAAHFERFNVLLLADFERTAEEQVSRRRGWLARWPRTPKGREAK